MTGFSDDQLSALRSPLARDHVKSRQQAGRTLSYVEGWVVVAEANRIFGFDAWDRETVECRCVAERESKLGPNKDRDGWRVAYVGRVRVKVRAGDQIIMREGTGYGSGIDADLGEAHESAAKECETDAMKRALMTFGNPFGLALYDKAQTEVEPVARRAPPPPSPAAQQPGRSATNGSGGPVAAGGTTRPFATTGTAPSGGDGGSGGNRTRDGGGPNATSSASRSEVEAAAYPNDRERRAKTATEAKRRITEALGVATTPGLIDQIVAINAVDLEEIMMLHRPSYDAVMELATRLKSDMYQAAG